MNILQAMKQLRDDLKIWVTNNINALNDKIEEKTIPIDSELNSTSINPVQNKAIASEIDDINQRVGDKSVAAQISSAIAAQPHFSGDYNDLTNAPDILEDESGDMIITDESGNIIFKADADGIHTTALSLNGEYAATQEYVNEAVANINIPEIDLTGYATETYVNNKVASLVNSAPEALDTLGELATALENHEDAYDALLETVGKKAAQADLASHTSNEDIHITSTERAQWHAKSNFSGDYNDLSNAPNITEDNTDNLVITDNAGNIIFRSDANGFETTTLTAQVITLNGADMETILAEKQPVGDYALKSEIPSTNSFATQDYVNAQIQAAVANLLTREQMVKYVEETILGGEW